MSVGPPLCGGECHCGVHEHEVLLLPCASSCVGDGVVCASQRGEAVGEHVGVVLGVRRLYALELGVGVHGLGHDVEHILPVRQCGCRGLLDIAAESLPVLGHGIGLYLGGVELHEPCYVLLEGLGTSCGEPHVVLIGPFWRGVAAECDVVQLEGGVSDDALYGLPDGFQLPGVASVFGAYLRAVDDELYACRAVEVADLLLAFHLLDGCQGGVGAECRRGIQRGVVDVAAGCDVSPYELQRRPVHPQPVWHGAHIGRVERAVLGPEHHVVACLEGREGCAQVVVVLVVAVDAYGGEVDAVGVADESWCDDVRLLWCESFSAEM